MWCNAIYFTSVILQMVAIYSMCLKERFSMEKEYLLVCLFWITLFCRIMRSTNGAGTIIKVIILFI